MMLILVCLAASSTPTRILGVSLLIAGVGSRTVMGFSPTIYASGWRTATPLCFCLIIITISALTEAYDQGIFTKKNLIMITACTGISLVPLVIQPIIQTLNL